MYVESYIRVNELTFNQAGKMSFVIGPFFGCSWGIYLRKIV